MNEASVFPYNPWYCGTKFLKSMPSSQLSSLSIISGKIRFLYKELVMSKLVMTKSFICLQPNPDAACQNFYYPSELRPKMEKFSFTSIKRISNDIKALLDTKRESNSTGNLLFCDGLFHTQLFP